MYLTITKIMKKKTNYILFIFQEGNFQTRSMLVPAEEFINARKNEFEMLLQESVKNIKIVRDSKENIIDNLLVQNIIWEGAIGRPEEKKYTAFWNIMCSYACGMDEDCYFEMCDKPWYDNSKINFCKNINHVKNYIECKNKFENIITGFLCLEANDGRLDDPVFGTTEELKKIISSTH